MAKKKEDKKGEEFHEIFNVRKDGKEKTIDLKGFEKDEKPSKNQVEKENKILRNFFIGLIIIVLGILAFYLFIDNAKHFTFDGMNFDVVKYCDTKPCLVVYQTSFPVLNNGVPTSYNFYLRNDPRKLNVPFDGEISFSNTTNKKNLKINITDDLNCEGDGIIGVANIVNFYKLAGLSFTRNESLDYSADGDTVFLDIEKGNETKVEQVGDSYRYNIYVNNCEVLQGTERFLVESFSEINQIINGN